jgi:NADH dehydrogenase (ubiquinone) Fe-S protein 1
MIIVGMSALRKNVSKDVHEAIAALRTAYPALVTPEWNGMNILHTDASRVGALDIGLQQAPASTRPKFVYLMGADDFDLSQIPDDAFVVYAGSHGDKGAERADIVLPASAYTEKNATYINMEGRVQQTNSAVSRLQNGRDDWQIVTALSEVCGVPLSYHSLGELHQRMEAIIPFIRNVDYVTPPSFVSPSFSATQYSNTKPSKATSVTFSPYFENYYMTDPISRCSVVMARCSQQLTSSRNSFISIKPDFEKDAQSFGTVLLQHSPDENRAFALP